MRKYPLAVLAGLSLTLIAVGGCTPASSSGGSSTQSGSPPASSPATSSAPVQSPPVSSPPISPNPGSGASSVTVCIAPVVSCSVSEQKSEPATLLLSGDGSVFVAAITWSGWGDATAQGSGTLSVDNCNPNCAQGSLSRYPATITVTNLALYGNGKSAYGQITVSAPADNYNQVYSTKLVP